ncbi:MAG TPA: SGNH/GDSL hydrolase family protein [Candidatus Saccharimonadales bacterium]
MKKLIFYTLSSLLFLVGIVIVAPKNASAATNNTYMSLGDSVAAGAGLPLSNGSQAALCAKSGQAYPFKVAAETGLALEHLACSGAKITDGILQSQERNGVTLSPQIDRAFANGTPKLITVTAGTNDINWAAYINKCYQSECGTLTDTATSSLLIWKVHQNMRSLLDQIKARNGADKPKVVVTGYYMPLSNAQPACTDTTGITSKEVNWVRQQATLLNIALSAVVYQYDFVSFAPVNFNGHELCSADSWIQGLGAPASYHPTAAGQKAIAQSVLDVLR